MGMKERTIPMSDPMNLVYIEGLEMEMEAWELMRLFFDADSILFVEDGERTSALNLSFRLQPGERGQRTLNASLLVIKANENEDGWCCSANLFTAITNVRELQKALALEMNPEYSHSQVIHQDELLRPGGRLFKSRKILVGACIVEVLSQYTGKRLPYGALTGVRPVKLAMQCLKDGMDKEQGVAHLIRVTGMSHKKAELLYDVAKAESPLMQTESKPIHLYVGIPFCLSRCLYCSFTSYPVKGHEHLVSTYLAALEKEILAVSQWIREYKLPLGSVYIGGGTPTALDVPSFSHLLTCLTRHFSIDGIEFTVEAGRPDTITREKLKVMKEQGVTRISINPQTMNCETLRLIGRNHTPEDIENTFALARDMGFNNINMDIIAGLPDEDEEMFRKTLEKIEAMEPEGLTVHTMAIKRASRLHEAQGVFVTTPDEVVETMIEEAAETARKMGMIPYYLYRQKNILANLENTGYAVPGRECLYNIQTMEEKQSLVALGAGAISKFIFPSGKMERQYNLKEVTLYIERIDEMIEKKKQYFTEGLL